MGRGWGLTAKRLQAKPKKKKKKKKGHCIDKRAEKMQVFCKT